MTSLHIDFTLILEMLNFVVLFLLLRWKLFGPLMELIENRKKKIEVEIKQAEESRKNAEILEKNYKERIAKIHEERLKIITQAKEEGETIKEEAKREALEEIEMMKLQTARDIELDKRKAFLSLKEEISNTAVEIASKILQKEIDIKTHKILIETFLEKL